MSALLAPQDHISACDAYLGERTGRYEWRCQRYDIALALMSFVGLYNEDTVCDVGAGWTEFGARMFTTRSARPRYWPVDGCLDGVDIETWVPQRSAEWFVALELLEHLSNPSRLVAAMQARATRGIIVSTPDPNTTDVLGMDRTHKTPVSQGMLESWGFDVAHATLYGGHWSNGQTDSLVGWWTP